MPHASDKLTRAQVDRLGERLRDSDPSEDDLRLLDQYRRSFHEPYEFVVRVIREHTGLNPTGRPAKSTSAIRDKLRRETIRLTQMQDIAGCRVVIDDIHAQETAVLDLKACFSDVVVVDRRDHPSHGYRAVHFIVRRDGKPVEVQVRTLLQHRWAEYSEKLADIFGTGLKYGLGDKDWLKILHDGSELIAEIESFEIRLHEWNADETEKAKLMEKNRQSRLRTERMLEEFIAECAKLKSS